MEKEDIEAFIKHSKGHILRHVNGILSGDKGVSPRDTQNCEEGKCEFLDVCRFEKWSVGRKGEEKDE